MQEDIRFPPSLHSTRITTLLYLLLAYFRNLQKKLKMWPLTRVRHSSIAGRVQSQRSWNYWNLSQTNYFRREGLYYGSRTVKSPLDMFSHFFKLFSLYATCFVYKRLYCHRSHEVVPLTHTTQVKQRNVLFYHWIRLVVASRFGHEYACRDASLHEDGKDPPLFVQATDGGLFSRLLTDWCNIYMHGYLASSFTRIQDVGEGQKGVKNKINNTDKHVCLESIQIELS